MAEHAADHRTEKSGRTMSRWLVFLPLLSCFGFVYWRLGGALIAQTNFTDKNIQGADQMHNIRLARKLDRICIPISATASPSRWQTSFRTARMAWCSRCGRGSRRGSPMRTTR